MRFLLVTLVTVCLGGAGTGDTPLPDSERVPPPSGKKEEKPPISAEWDLAPLAKDFIISGRRYDPVKKQLIWSVEARKDMNGPKLQANFMDGDRVVRARREIVFHPAHSAYEAGARFEAFLSLPELETCNETACVVIRKASPARSD